jgi:TonB family protein
MICRLCLIVAAMSLMDAAEAPAPSQLYVVSVFFSDNGALLYYRLTEVRPEGTGSLVRYIRVAPVNTMCARRMIVQAAEVRTPNASPAQLVRNNNPCAMKPSAFRSTLKKYARRSGIFEANSFGLAGQCGTSSTVFELPDFSFVDVDRLRQAHPEMARLWDLDSQIIERAFGAQDIFHNRSEEDDLALQRAGQERVPDLTSGRYDAGLKAALKGIGVTDTFGFREVLSDYRGPISLKALDEKFVPRVVDAQSYNFKQYVAPIYPPLAKQARVEGRVELQLKVEPSTGEIRDTKALSGHQLLVPSALAAVKRWRFDPGSVASGDVTLALEYSLNCP